MVSEEGLAAGPGTKFDHSRAFVEQSFIKVRKETELLTQTQKRDGMPPSLVLARP